jgi:hypothetical protein
LTGYVSLRDAGRIEAVHPTAWSQVPGKVNLVLGPGDVLRPDLSSCKVTIWQVVGAIGSRNPDVVGDNAPPPHRELEPHHDREIDHEEDGQSTITTDLACRVTSTDAPG